MSTRLEATLPAPRVLQLQQLATELHMSKSDLVAEAVTILLEAAQESRRGHRLAFVDAARGNVRELALPSLSQLAWTAHEANADLTPAARKRARKVLAKPAAPTAALRKAFARRTAR